MVKNIFTKREIQGSALAEVACNIENKYLTDVETSEIIDKGRRVSQN